MNDRDRFIELFACRSAVRAALGRSPGVYVKRAKVAEREAFRHDLMSLLRETAQAYRRSVTDTEHLRKIRRIRDRLTRKHRRILKGGRFRFGRAQKALNLYLKYLWCLGELPMPPHCPFDRKIIQECGLPEIGWAKLDDGREYRRLVAAARQQADARSMAIAEWELGLFNRHAPDLP